MWIESPTNPRLLVYDIAAIAEAAHQAGALLVVDNTFATPLFQQPFQLGADLVVHSVTKYLGGHSDLIQGAVLARDPAVFEPVKFLQNATGAVPSPFDCWLTLRGLKTLELRMQRHADNAEAIAHALKAHALVPTFDVGRSTIWSRGSSFPERGANAASEAGSIRPGLPPVRILGMVKWESRSLDSAPVEHDRAFLPEGGGQPLSLEDFFTLGRKRAGDMLRGRGRGLDGRRAHLASGQRMHRAMQRLAEFAGGGERVETAEHRVPVGDDLGRLVAAKAGSIGGFDVFEAVFGKFSTWRKPLPLGHGDRRSQASGTSETCAATIRQPSASRPRLGLPALDRQVRVAEERAHHGRPLVHRDDHRARQPAARRYRRVLPAPGGDLVGAVLAVRDAVAHALRVVPEQLREHGDVALGQRPFVPLERRPHLREYLRKVEDSAVPDPRLDPQRHAGGAPRRRPEPAPAPPRPAPARPGPRPRVGPRHPRRRSAARRFTAQKATSTMPANR